LGGVWGAIITGRGEVVRVRLLCYCLLSKASTGISDQFVVLHRKRSFDVDEEISETAKKKHQKTQQQQQQQQQQSSSKQELRDFSGW